SKSIVVKLDEKIHQGKKFGETDQNKICNGLLNFESYAQSKKNLGTLVLSTECTSSRFQKETLGKEVVNLIISAHFWDDVVRAYNLWPFDKSFSFGGWKEKPTYGLYL
ncbi:hypothetical protein EJD97_012088, partial [Solanum chilense]